MADATGTGNHKLLGLDHLRAFAIVYVVCFHYKFFGHPDWEVAPGSFGWTGVDLFFVLSGFLISGQLFATIAKEKTLQLRAFFIKRFFRIIPPYLLVLILYFSFPVLTEWGHLSPAWKYLTFTLNFGLDLRKYSAFSHAWSLCVEEQFYLMLPLCLWLFIRFKVFNKAWILIILLFAAGFVVRLLCWHYQVAPRMGDENLRPLWNKYVYYPTYNRLDGLLVGISIAGLFTFYPKVKQWANRNTALLMLTGIGTLTGAYFVCIPKEGYYATLYGFTLVSLGYGFIVAAAVCPGSFLYRFKSKTTKIIASLSYSIYLVHKIVIHITQVLLEKTGMDKNSGMMMICCFATTVLAALVMRYLVEKPALRLRNKVLQNINNTKSLQAPVSVLSEN